MKGFKKFYILGLIITFAISFCSTITEAENSGFVSTNGRHLSLNTTDFYFNGANQYYLFFKSQSMVDEILTDASNLGINVIRTWGFCDGVWKDGYSFQPEPGVYDENTFRKMDYIIYKANQLNIRLIIPLVNNWNDFGGMNAYVEWSGTAMTHDDFYTDEQCKTFYKNYVRHFITRVNTYTGVAYKDDPTIMAWELANEPRCESDKTGNTLYAWIEEMSSFIKSIDPNHLVSTGEEGWYVNKGDDWKYNGYEGADFIRNSQCPYVDICSFHLYPQFYNMSESEAMLWIDEHIDDAHFIVGKPVYLGEFGWEVPREIIGDFSHGIENWKVDWGYSSSYPVRVENPSQNANGSIVYYPAGSLDRYQNAAGERWLNPPMDFREYDLITAWVYIPDYAPSDMKADLYTKSGESWVWNESQYYSLTPGEWTMLTFYTLNIHRPDQVRSVGIRVTNGGAKYSGPVYYDMIIASSEIIGKTMGDRNRVYGNWYNNIDLRDSDGAILWILNGHEDDTTFYPDYDNYGVYYPEDPQTCDIILNYSNIVAAKNSNPPPDAYPSVSINSPTEGSTVSGTVTIQATATDDNGVSSVTYSIDGGATVDMSYVGSDIWQANWDSTGVSDGSYTITVSATDTASQTSTDQVNVNVDNVVSEYTVYVKNIDLSLRKKGKGGIKKQCFATILVVDNKGKPAKDAAVYTHWSGGLVSDSDVTFTDKRGLAKNISSDKANAKHGTFRITVDDIVKNGYAHDPSLNVETSDEINF